MALDRIVEEFLGIDSPTDADWNAKVGGLLASNDTLETENTGYKEQIVELKAQIEKLEALKQKAELGEKYLTDTREAALAAYKRAKGDGASEAMERTIGSADLDQALAMKVEFEGEAEKRFPLKCEACGAVQLTRRSSQEEEGSEDTEDIEDAASYQVR